MEALPLTIYRTWGVLRLNQRKFGLLVNVNNLTYSVIYLFIYIFIISNVVLRLILINTRSSAD